MTQSCAFRQAHNSWLCYALRVSFTTATQVLYNCRLGVYLLQEHQVAQGAALRLHQDICMGDGEDLLLYGCTGCQKDPGLHHNPCQGLDETHSRFEDSLGTMPSHASWSYHRTFICMARQCSLVGDIPTAHRNLEDHQACAAHCRECPLTCMTRRPGSP